MRSNEIEVTEPAVETDRLGVKLQSLWDTPEDEHEWTPFCLTIMISHRPGQWRSVMTEFHPTFEGNKPLIFTIPRPIWDGDFRMKAFVRRRKGDVSCQCPTIAPSSKRAVIISMRKSSQVPDEVIQLVLRFLMEPKHTLKGLSMSLV